MKSGRSFSRSRRARKARAKRRLSRYLDITIYRAYAGIKADQSKNYAGSLWFFLDPALSACVYIALGKLFKHQTSDFIAFVIVGSFVWQFMAASMTDMMNSITSSRGVIRQVHIPKFVFPVSTLLINVFKFCITLLILAAGLLLFGAPLTAAYLALPLLLLVTVLLILGAGLPMAALIPFVPDTREAIRAGLRLLGFVSGIFFSIESVDPGLRAALWINPFAGMLTVYRSVLIDGQWPSWPLVGYILVVASAFSVIGFGLIFKWDRHYGKALAS